MRIREKNKNVNDPEFLKKVLRKLNAKLNTLEKTMYSNFQCFETLESDASKLVPKNAKGKDLANRWLILSAEIQAKTETLKRIGEFPEWQQ